MFADKVAKFLGGLLGSMLPDILLFGGIFAVVWGIRMWSIPSAFIAGGVMAIVLGLSAGGNKKP